MGYIGITAYPPKFLIVTLFFVFKFRAIVSQRGVTSNILNLTPLCVFNISLPIVILLPAISQSLLQRFSFLSKSSGAIGVARSVLISAAYCSYSGFGTSLLTAFLLIFN